MAAAMFTSLTGGGSSAFADGTSMSYDKTGIFCVDFAIGTPYWKIEPQDAPGVDGQGTINYGYRSQGIIVKVCYIDGSENSVSADVTNDNKVIGSGPSTLLVAGQTFQACILHSMKPVDRQPRPTGYGTFYQFVNIEVEAVRLP
jgi:hypothetical protein